MAPAITMSTPSRTATSSATGPSIRVVPGCKRRLHPIFLSQQQSTDDECDNDGGHNPFQTQLGCVSRRHFNSDTRLAYSAVVPDGGYRPGERVALKPLQIGAHLRGTLIAKAAVFLDRFVDDFFQLQRDLRFHYPGRCGR